MWTERQQQDAALQRAILESKAYYETKRDLDMTLARARREILNLTAAVASPMPEKGPVAVHR